MSQLSEHEARRAATLANLQAFEDAVLPNTEDEYQALLKRRGELDALWWYMDADEPAYGRVKRLLNEHSELVSSYNALFELPAGDDRTLVRYLLWQSYFAHVDRRVSWLEARDRGLLRKQARVDNAGYCFLVVGLRCKVGDNTFTVDRRGREHRQYCQTIGRQAIYTVHACPFEGEDLAAFLETVPDLPEDYATASCRDGKYAVRPIAFRKKESDRVFHLLRASPHASSPRIRPEEPAAVPPVPPQAPTPTTGDLFEDRAAA